MTRKSIAPPLIKSIIFVVVTVLATAILGISIARVGIGNTVNYYARFSNVTGLEAGDGVRIAGVRVGQVEDISVVDRRYARVRFAVQVGRELPASVTATIKYRNMVGQRYLALERGAGPVGQTLPPGGEIPPEQTEPALSLTALFNGFQPLFKALSPKETNKLAGNIIAVFQGQETTVDSLVAQTASLTNTLAAKDKVIGEVIDNLNEVLKTINSREDAFGDLVTTMQQLVSGLSRNREEIGEAIDSMSGLTQSSAELLREGREPLRKDIGALRRLSTTLANSTPTIETFLNRLPVKMEQIATINSYGSWMNAYLCKASLTGLTYTDVSPPPSPAPPPLDGIQVTQARCMG